MLVFFPVGFVPLSAQCAQLAAHSTSRDSCIPVCGIAAISILVPDSKHVRSFGLQQFHPVQTTLQQIVV